MGQTAAIRVRGLEKVYDDGFRALEPIDLDIDKGEIFALLGPNGAGKTTLINAVCGIVRPSAGTILVAGHDHAAAYREARSAIGLVPQELTTDAFESVWATVSFSRGLFGKPRDPGYVEDVLRRLSLWDKRHQQIRTLSGGMKRRVMIAKALSHEPEILFLDEPSAGVDVELRKSMWAQVRALRETGVTIILTTHYLEEAEEMADRIGVIQKGRLILTEDKHVLMRRMGERQMTFLLREKLAAIPDGLSAWPLTLGDDGLSLVLRYDGAAENDVSEVTDALKAHGIRPKDVASRQSSLEEIFIRLVEAA